MVEECQRIGIPIPEFHTDGGFVWVVFHYLHTTVGYHPTSTPQVPHKYPTSTPQVETIVRTIGYETLSVKEMMDMLKLKDRKSFLYSYLYPAIEQGLVEPLYPDQPKHPRQKYRVTEKGETSYPRKR
jgi:ATP-dependent DNA helicase RecG